MPENALLKLREIFTFGPKVAIRNSTQAICYNEIEELTANLSKNLSEHSVYGVLLDNSLEWVLADLAIIFSEAIAVPLPTFFTALQIQHAIITAGITAIVTDNPDRIASIANIEKVDKIDGFGLWLVHCPYYKNNYPKEHIAKITFTSGSTGTPKGVCLPLDTILRVSCSLIERAHIKENDKHLSLLPLSVLLENIAGIYTPLLAGAEIYMPSPNEVGITGTAQIEIEKVFLSLKESQATTTILTPQFLKLLVSFMEKRNKTLTNMRFIAVGGATVANSLHMRANKLKLPVYEGYGLSESTSVVSLNSPGSMKKNSVGKILPHISVKISDEGEILVKGANFIRYLQTDVAPCQNDYWPTGDIGFIDEDKFLFIRGRKKNQIINSFGRNIEPEWIESELCAHDVIQQAAIFGDGEAYIIAVIVSLESQSNISKIVSEVNTNLPDYAQVKQFILLKSPFTKDNGMLTNTGKNIRDNIYRYYEEKIKSLYL